MNFLEKKMLIIILALTLAAGVQAKQNSIEIYRPENYGNLNDVPCLLKITDPDGNDAWDKITHISYSWAGDMRNKDKLTHSYYRGCFTGGCIIHLTMRPGTYRISVCTPRNLQQDYELSYDSAEGDWTSNEFIYQTNAEALKVIFINPCANRNGFFTGKWNIDYRAPKFYRYTKPKMD